MKIVFIVVFFATFLVADDYSFDFKELEKIEVKTYEYTGYLKGEYKHQRVSDTTKENYYGEAFLNARYFYDKFTFEGEFMGNYENIDHREKDTYFTNQLFINYKYNENHQINFGKKTANWGKGYFFNPVAFIDRKKDPTNPEASKEGYVGINYKYNKVFQNDLQNIALDMVYLKTTSGLNEDFYHQNSNTLALKTYFLYKDVDIDFIYFYNEKLPNKYGMDFSSNLQTNFEIHGEIAQSDDGLYSYLIGLKYLTDFDLTIISEYFFQNEELSKTQNFWDNRYFFHKLTQKEPLDILYLSVYYKNIYNLDDHSQQNSLGFINTQIKNLTIDFSIGKNSGKRGSEFGGKLVDKFTWLQLKYSF